MTFSSKRRSLVTAIEYYLTHPEKLAALEPKLKRLFWRARDWHPVVRMNWASSIDSNGEGLLTYADGSTATYQLRNWIA